MLSFRNTEIAFKHKSDRELRSSVWLFSLMGNTFLAIHGSKLVNFALKLHLPVKALLKNTLFQHFCGGETLRDTVKTSENLNKYGVKTILDYSVEGEKTEKGFDACRDEIIRTLEHSRHHREVIFSACKVSGLGSTELLSKIQSGASLSNVEKDEESRIIKRIEAIAFASVRNQTPIFIDAEESWFQDWIDQITEKLMRRHNQESVWIYTTLQMYRHDRLAYLKKLHAQAKEQGYSIGVKLVRGAYMEKERQRALEMNYASPIQADKASTDQDFDAACMYCLENISHIAVCAGTHNENSCDLMARKIAQSGLAHNHPNISFAQLLGMSDHISYNLASEGFTSAKYLPYGPVEAVMPYLFRRAQENTSIAGQSSRELELLRTEVKRRKNIVK